MSKTWGIMMLSVLSAPSLAETELAHNFCGNSMQTSAWQPLIGLDLGMVDIRSDDIELLGTQSAEFTGDVDINTLNMSLSAQSALIDKQRGLLNATGPIIYRDAISEVNSAGLNADLNNSEISLLGADYKLTEQQGHGGAEKLTINQSGLNLLNASFTTCPNDTPLWAIQAEEILLSSESGWGETHDMVLRIMDTPVLYLPYFTFPIDDRRKSGLLTPNISSSDRYGVETITPYYWNIAPNFDATITPRYMSKKGVQLINEFRYLTENSNGLLGLEFLQKDDSEPQLKERFLFHWQQQSYFGDKWRANIDITNVSDDNYLTDLGSDYATRTDTQLYRTGSLSYLGERWRTDIKVQNFEVLGNHSDSYAAWPQIGFSQTEPYKLSNVEFTLDGEISHFTNSDAVIDKATRLHLEPKASYGYQEYAWSFLSEFSLLHTNYKQEGDLAGSDYADSVSRTLPKVRLYSQLNFERDTSLVKNGIQTLEPQMQYLYTPDKDQSDIGLYDTTKLQDDFFGLFRDKRFSSVDRIASANQFTLGATTRLFSESNEELFNFSAGQIFYLNDSAKPSAQGINPNTNYNALFAAQTMVHWHRRWYLSGGVQYDADGKQIIQSNVTLDYKGDNNQLVQLNHRYANDVSGNTIEQVGLFTSFPISEQWQFVNSYHRDLDTGRSIEIFSGLQYESCCWAFQLTARRQIETDLNQSIGQEQATFDSSIGFNIVLKGLGSKSRYDAQKLLQQGIFGYRRPYFLNN
ncbi:MULTISPECIES: LPS assembly protein LptD [unclassified Pseudoalteromonas]|uniref:LPS assembly protein LptD n=1 Tax=unclassified Pseudoalteromonas TaxID=194690 RepID=UPI000C07F2CC|nr:MULTISPECIES: LPS assembly protein LptD [unclassified Pseudoalteromonas]MDP2634294.1 LPS assembly protein LptD [Pseudoalteromonas sp. 1_MG-2023]PHN90975.1 LPS biosynthesis protein [Pseudoalteromonas sp. 3D05]